MTDPLKINTFNLRSPEINPRTMRPPQSPRAEATSSSFRDTLREAITQVEQLQSEADSTIRQLVAGDIKDVTEAMVAMEQADVAFQTMMTVRNRVVTAYEEIMRMQV